MPKTTRYQGAIVRDRQILLLQQTDHLLQRSYWLLPGGRKEPGETDEQCIEREMLEEVGVHVRVEGLVLDEPIESENIDRRKTYRCSIISGEPTPGHEPEDEYAERYSFTGVQWLDLQRSYAWSSEVSTDQGPLLKRIREMIGFIEQTNSEDTD
jgi:8-oxo-dGTP diphosphatase